MENPLEHLASVLRDHVQHSGAEKPLGGVGVFHCRSTQQLHAVPLHQACIVFVVSGVKHIQVNTRRYSCSAGRLALFAAGTHAQIENIPAVESDYLAIAIAFPSDMMSAFIENYGASLTLHQQPRRDVAVADARFVTALSQWVHWCRDGEPSLLIQLHRLQELLLLLAEQGEAGNLFVPTAQGWRARVAQLLSMRPAHAWRIEDVAAHFACSEATLRRHLEREQTGFRPLLEEVRLVAGLSLLQETDWTVLRVAQTVGYESASRFAERFRQRFGLTPQGLRKTRVSDCGADVTESGAREA